jgi:uncharacterized protein DUF1348
MNTERLEEGDCPNENWQFDENGMKRLRFACITDLPIKESDRRGIRSSYEEQREASLCNRYGNTQAIEPHTDLLVSVLCDIPTSVQTMLKVVELPDPPVRLAIGSGGLPRLIKKTLLGHRRV